MNVNPNIFQPKSEKEVNDYIIKKFNLVKDSKGFYNTKGYVDLSNRHLNEIPLKFGYVGGWFNCTGNKLTSLEGAPRKLGGSFDCSHNILTSLKGSPRRMHRPFICSHNKLVSLEGCPKSTNGHFNCSYNNISKIEEFPTCIIGNLFMSNNPISAVGRRVMFSVKGRICMV